MLGAIKRIKYYYLDSSILVSVTSTVPINIVLIFLPLFSVCPQGLALSALLSQLVGWLQDTCL